MKTKYIAVPVSERLPEKEGKYQCITKSGNFKYVSFSGVFIYEPFYEEEELEYWLEEVPDHSEEMEEMLNEIFLELDSLWDHEHNNSVFGVIDVKKIAELLNKVKDNGK